MNELFLKIINMSIAANWLILAVLILRFVLKKAPKWVNVLLWGIVAVRLICPFSFESALSLIPSAETVHLDIEMDWTPAIDSGINAINNVINPIISASFTPNPVASANPLQIWIPLASILWIFGMIMLLLYTAISYWRLRRKVDTAVRYKDNIFQSENVNSPFVLGIIKPRIYLPFKLDGQDLEHVVAHEQAHIRRKDHWRKPLGFLLLTIHWFNPLLWLAYVLLCRDIELACDEKVIKDLGNEQRADYTQALVACSVNRRIIAACPLAFGEVGVKERVKSVLNYKKPAFWVIVVSLIACAVVAVCFLTNPKDAIEGYYQIEGYGIYNDSEYHIIVNDGVELKCTKEQYEKVTSLIERFRTGEDGGSPIHVTYKQFLISYKRGTVIELEIPEELTMDNSMVTSTEDIALQAFANLLSGDRTLLNSAQAEIWWIPDFQDGVMKYEYTYMDLDGDDVAELLIQYDFNDTRSYTVFRYLANGETENISYLFAREELIDPNSTDPCPYYTVGGNEVDKDTFDEELNNLIANRILNRSAWTEN